MSVRAPALDFSFCRLSSLEVGRPEVLGALGAHAASQSPPISEWALSGARSSVAPPAAAGGSAGVCAELESGVGQDDSQQGWRRRRPRPPLVLVDALRLSNNRLQSIDGMAQAFGPYLFMGRVRLLRCARLLLSRPTYVSVVDAGVHWDPPV
eukprot:COSAG01_NODE_1983_length_8729_cov_2.848801_6_plen_152_part_00